MSMIFGLLQVGFVLVLKDKTPFGVRRFLASNKQAQQTIVRQVTLSDVMRAFTLIYQKKLTTKSLLEGIPAAGVELPVLRNRELQAAMEHSKDLTEVDDYWDCRNQSANGPYPLSPEASRISSIKNRSGGSASLGCIVTPLWRGP
eukprot:TRINITY_DN7019_c0_g1_i1.p1 TRINITY_DN7019_c0_g1~~TRINITY_DN7019_c0_g1_i1.p1  ORF type:complete len:145 (+),score=15.77 TRINITY_DN7019_c0_g1_i1:68-502(+)